MALERRVGDDVLRVLGLERVVELALRREEQVVRVRDDGLVAHLPLRHVHG